MLQSTRIPQIGTHTARLWLGWKTSAVAPLTGELLAASTRLKRSITEITSGESSVTLTSWHFQEEVCVSQLNTWIFEDMPLEKIPQYRFGRFRTLTFFTWTARLLMVASSSLMSAVLLPVKTILVGTVMLMLSFAAQQGITQRHSGGLVVTWPSSGWILHDPINQSRKTDQHEFSPCNIYAL